MIQLSPNTLLAKHSKKIKVQNPVSSVARRPFDVPDSFQDFASECQIRSQSTYVPFNLYDYQIEVASLLDQYKRICIYKTRQLGASEVVACKMLHRSLLNPAYLGTVLSMGQDESSKIALRVQNMPLLSGFLWESKSTTQVKAEGCGTILFRPSTDNAVRSLPSVTDLFFDEAAFIQKIRELYSGATPAQKMAGDDAKTYIVSTMSEEGALSWFWEIFSSDCPVDVDIDQKIAHVREGKGEYGAGIDYWIDDAGWCKVLLHWKSHPIYSQVPDYLEKTRRDEKLTEAKLQREYNLGLPATGGSLFNAQSVNECAIGKWSGRVLNRTYLICVDPNFGGSDYWVTQVWDVSVLPFSLVAQYRQNEKSMTYSQSETLKLIDTYYPVLTAVESNSGGIAVAERLLQARPGVRVETTQTTATSKKVNTDRIALAVEDHEVIFPPDWVGKQEMKQFSALERRGVNANDDCVMAFAAGWAWIEEAARRGSFEYDSIGGREILEY